MEEKSRLWYSTAPKADASCYGAMCYGAMCSTRTLERLARSKLSIRDRQIKPQSSQKLVRVDHLDTILARTTVMVNTLAHYVKFLHASGI